MGQFLSSIFRDAASLLVDHEPVTLAVAAVLAFGLHISLVVHAWRYSSGLANRASQIVVVLVMSFVLTALGVAVFRIASDPSLHSFGVILPLSRILALVMLVYIIATIVLMILRHLERGRPEYETVDIFSPAYRSDDPSMTQKLPPVE